MTQKSKFTSATKIARATMMIVFALVCLSQTRPSYAASSKKTTKSSDKKKSEKKKSFEKEEVPLDEKKEAKDTKKWQVLFNAGMEPSPLIGIGATIGKKLSPSLALEGFFSRASGKVEPVAITVMNGGVRARKSFGNIPYVAAGLGVQMATGSWFTYNETQTDELATTSAANAITLNLAAGGQLRFGSFVLGADAVGIIFPVAKMGVKDTPPTDPYDQADFDEQKAKFTKVAGGMGLVIFKVGIGLAF